MDFAYTALSGLMATMPADQVAAAEWANLCLEERVAAPRQAVYEARMDRPAEWLDFGVQRTFDTSSKTCAAGIP